MNRLRSFFLIFSFLIGLTISNLFATSYVVDTSKGPQVVEIPSGYTTLEAYLEMSKLYLEERYDLEELQLTVTPLLDSIEQYKKDVKGLEDSNEILIQDYKDLEILYKDKSKVRVFQPTISLGVQQGGIGEIHFHVSFGGILFEKIMLQTMISYPFALGISIGVQF